MNSNRNVRKTVFLFIIVIVLASVFPLAIAAADEQVEFVPIWDGTPYVYNGIPFKIVTSMQTGEYESPLCVYHSFAFKATDTIDLSGYIADKIHILEYASYADNVPDGVIVGQIVVYYEDGTSSTIDLINGVNTGEWAYDRPNLQPYLQHTKISPAYSFWTNLFDTTWYWGHLFYVVIDTEHRSLNYLELVLDQASYTGQEYYGCSHADCYKIDISAITIEKTGVASVVSATIDVDPDTLNLKSNGEWITAYIELPEGYDVNDIDVSTIYLVDTIPVDTSAPATVGDYDSDGTSDLMVKFDRTAVVAYLGTEDATEDVTGTDYYEELTIIGELTDGTQFEGSDMIRVIDKGKSK